MTLYIQVCLVLSSPSGLYHQVSTPVVVRFSCFCKKKKRMVLKPMHRYNNIIGSFLGPRSVCLHIRCEGRLQRERLRPPGVSPWPHGQRSVPSPAARWSHAGGDLHGRRDWLPSCHYLRGTSFFPLQSRTCSQASPSCLCDKYGVIQACAPLSLSSSCPVQAHLTFANHSPFIQAIHSYVRSLLHQTCSL